MKKIPKEVLEIVGKLRASGFEAYLVGGCVRNFLLGAKPKDWDATTNATPEEIQKIFPDSFYENEYGTVGVKTDSDNESLKVVEITPYRLEEKYSDKRHPDQVRFTKNLEDDLKRRDFTINALAYNVEKEELIDKFGGEADLKKKIIRAVGEPEERFREDALRLMRAVRFASELGFEIEPETEAAVKKLSGELKFISKERVRDEFVKTLESEDAAGGVEKLRELGLLSQFLPELLEGVGVGQNLHHVFTVWEHNLKALEYSVKKGYSLEVRLASLLHDVAKPRAKRGEGKYSTFYGHDVLGAKMSAKVLERLRFPKDFSEKVVRLVRWHLFYYNVGEVSESSVRRVLRNVGPDLIEDLIRVREADRIGSGVPKAVPYKLRHFKFMVEKVQKDPISVGMLKMRGDEVMKILGIEPGPKVGMVLSALLEEVLENPSKNEPEYLEGRVRELGKLSEKELRGLAERGKEKKEEAELAKERELKEKYWVA